MRFSDNFLLFAVLASVLSVGLAGIFLSGASITGFVSANSSFSYTILDFMDVGLDSGACDGFYPVLNVTLPSGDTGVYFDANCTSSGGAFAVVAACEVLEGPCDNSYCGNVSWSRTPLVIISDFSNVGINLSGKRNASLPAGFDGDDYMMQVFNSNDTPSGTTLNWKDENCWYGRNTTQYIADGWLTTYQVLAKNWSNGSGVGGSPPARLDVLTGWLVSPNVVASGTYTIRYDFLAVET